MIHPASVLPERCAWCFSTDDLALVGIIEQNSGPGGSVHACGGCRRAHRILTVEEHPPGSLGGVRYRPTPGAAR